MDVNMVARSPQVFPAAGSDGFALFAEGGQALMRDLKFWSLDPIWDGRA